MVRNLLQGTHVSVLSLGLGLTMVLAVMAMLQPSLSNVSPFALTALVLVVGMLVSSILGFNDLVNFYPNLRSMLPLSMLGAVLLFASTFSFVFSIKFGASPFMFVAVLALSPMLVGLWRRVFWLEIQEPIELFGLLIAHVGLGIWFTKSQTLAFGCAYFGVHFWALLMTLVRPQLTLGASGAVWTWISIFAGLIGLPILWGFDEFMRGSRIATLMGTRYVGFEFTDLLPIVLFGSIMNAGRFFVGIRSRKIFSALPLSLLWVVGMMVAVIVLAVGFNQFAFKAGFFAALAFSAAGLACYAVAEYRRAEAMRLASPENHVPETAQAQMVCKQEGGHQFGKNASVDTTQTHSQNDVPVTMARVTHLFDSGHRLWSK